MLKDSKFIVPFVGFTEDPMYLVFKFVPLTLSNILRNRRDSSVSSLVNIARDIACGMRDIHANNIVHFDLKPGKKVF